jgi:hypothetical protein
MIHSFWKLGRALRTYTARAAKERGTPHTPPALQCESLVDLELSIAPGLASADR